MDKNNNVYSPTMEKFLRERIKDLEYQLSGAKSQLTQLLILKKREGKEL